MTDVLGGLVMNIIDLRSDTVTWPTDAMRQAMFEANVGDDVYGEDPTVNQLENIAANITGKEDAVLVSSGTQGNLLSVLSSCKTGDGIIMGSDSHMVCNELAGLSDLGRINPMLVENDSRGMMRIQDIESAIKDSRLSGSGQAVNLLCFENTHNFCNGGVITVQETEALVDLAHLHGMLVHLDGARIFNAAVYLNVPIMELTKKLDSVTFCLSKGLSAPVGSLLCGSTGFVAKAREWRRKIGGGMRQAGVVAAAGIVAIDEMTSRLVDDHLNAYRLSSGLSKIPRIIHNPDEVQTNILFFKIQEGSGDMKLFVERLSREGIKCHLLNGRIRMVTHRHISSRDVDFVLAKVAEVMMGLVN